MLQRLVLRLYPTIRELVAIFLLPLFVGWSVVSKRLPKEEHLWVFGPSSSGKFLDNSKYFYLYASQNTDNRCVWISHGISDETLHELRERGYEAYNSSSTTGKYLLLRSKFVFLSYRPSLISAWFVAGARIVQLWHGNPLKRLNTPSSTRARLPSTRFLSRALNNWSILVVTGEYPRKIFQEVFSIPEDRMLVCGYPRNDVLLRSVPDAGIEQASEIVDWIAEQTSKVLMYLPTWRGDDFKGNHNPIHPDNFPIDDIADLLDEHDAYLLIKPHPRTDVSYVGSNSKRIVVLSSDLDVYPILRHIDALVTDYSSVFFDFLLLDRPIVFYPFDFDEYVRNRGFYFDYRTDLPGPIADTPSELINLISRTISGEDDFRLERRDMNELINGGSYGDASQCVLSSLIDVK